MDNKTVFYTEGFMELIAEVEEVIFLNKGDVFLGKGGHHYVIVWKVYNPKLNIMIYHGKPTMQGQKLI